MTVDPIIEKLNEKLSIEMQLKRVLRDLFGVFKKSYSILNNVLVDISIRNNLHEINSNNEYIISKMTEISECLKNLIVVIDSKDVSNIDSLLVRFKISINEISKFHLNFKYLNFPTKIRLGYKINLILDLLKNAQAIRNNKFQSVMENIKSLQKEIINAGGDLHEL